MVSLRIRVSGGIYVVGLLLTPVAIGSSAVLEAWGRDVRPGLGVAWLLLLGFLICLAGAFGMKKTVGQTVVLMLIPVVILPIEALLMGALLVEFFGLRGVQ